MSLNIKLQSNVPYLEINLLMTLFTRVFQYINFMIIQNEIENQNNLYNKCKLEHCEIIF